MDNRYKYLIKNTEILTISSLSTKILTFLMVPLYTSVLTTEEYGTYDLAVSTVSLLIPILSVNIVDGVMRYSMDSRYDRADIFSIGLRRISVAAFIFAAILAANSVLHITNVFAGEELLILLYFISTLLYSLLTQFAKGCEAVKQMAIAGIISTVCLVGTNILLLLVFELGVTGFFIASCASQLIPAIYLAVRLEIWSYTHLKISKKVQAEVLKYSAPLVLTAVSWWINSASDKYVVSFLIGVSANGILSVAYKIPTILNTIQQLFLQAWQISAVKEYNADSKVFYQETFQILDALMSLLALGLILTTRILAHVLYAKDFFVAWKYVPFLLISSVINTASGYLGAILSAKKDSKTMGESAVISAIANTVMNIVFVKWFGVQGATIATALSSFLIFAIRASHTQDVLPKKSIFTSFFVWLMLCVTAWLYVYSKHYILILIPMVAVLMCYRKVYYTLLCSAKRIIKKK